MSRLRSWVSNIKDFVSDINPATLSGAIDIIVIRQPDGTLKSSPFHVRFGKLYLLRAKEKEIHITINGEPVKLNIKMRIGDNGEAFFTSEPDEVESSAMSAAASVGSMSPPCDRRQRHMSETSDTSDRTLVNFDANPSSSSASTSALPSPIPKQAPSTPPRKSSRPMDEMAPADVPPERMETIPQRTPADGDTLIEWRWGDLPRTEEDARKDAAALQEAAAHAPDGAVVVPHGAVVVPTVGGAAVSGAVMVTGAGALLVPAPESVVSAGPANAARDPKGVLGVTVTEPEAAAAAVADSHAAGHTESSGLLARIGATLWRSSSGQSGGDGGVYLDELVGVRPPNSNPLASPGPALDAPASPTSSASPTPPQNPAPFVSAIAPIIEDTAMPNAGLLISVPAPAAAAAVPLSPAVAAGSSSSTGHLSSSAPASAPASGDADGFIPATADLVEANKEEEEEEEDPATAEANEENTEEELGNEDMDAISFHSTHEDVDVDASAKGELFLDVLEAPPSVVRPPAAERDVEGESSGDPGDYGAAAADAALSPSDVSGGVSFTSSPQSRTPTEDRILGGPLDSAASTSALSSLVSSDLTSPTSIYSAASIRASLCGKANRDYTTAENQQLFDKYAVTFEKLNQVPSLYSDPNLVLCIDGKYHPWTIAAPLLLSRLLFQRELETATLEKLWTAEKRGGWRSFFFGGREQKNTVAVAAATAAVAAATGTLVPNTGAAAAPALLASLPTPTTVPATPLAVQPTATLVPIPAAAAATALSTGRPRGSLRLSSEQLHKLNLRDGVNKAAFTIISKMQGKQSVQCNIYLWNFDEKIVISDIDGTITRSDVMGHVAAFLSKDWTHAGVAGLYSNIEKNGYKFVYLSSRSISHSGPTREYLKGVKQGEAFKLPDGPVLLSPASLMMSIHLEIIRRKPEEFKVSCLRDIKRLFPRCHRTQCVCCCTPPAGLESFDACTCMGESPFTAGFGNRATDELSYRAVGISPFRIFVIDPSSRVRASVGAFRSSYERLGDVVNEMFPPRCLRAASEPVASFGDTSYWSIPPPAFDESFLRSLNPPS